MDEKRVRELRELFVFQLLTPKEMEEIVGAFHEKVYSAGMRIFLEENRGDTMYIIKSGSVKISKHRKGREEEIAVLSRGDFFGEIALFEYVLRTATATALEETLILEITRNKFNELFFQKPHIVGKILFQMMIEMGKRLRKESAKITL